MTPRLFQIRLIILEFSERTSDIKTGSIPMKIDMNLMKGVMSPKRKDVNRLEKTDVDARKLDAFNAK